MGKVLSAILVMLIGILSVAGILFLLGRILYLIFDLIIGSFHFLRTKINPTEIEQILRNTFPYYRNLSVNEKKRFTSRLQTFMDRREFIAREHVVITEEMKVLISASAIQITFGLEEYNLPHFSKIFIYPKAFYSMFTKQYHKGDTNLSGGIAFSWEDFKEGYAKQNDNYNVGLHEMAHALRFSSFRSEEYDRFFVNYFDKWSSIAMDEFSRIQKDEASFLRKYAGTNMNEFFAVCTEYFFESPKELREKIPDLYKHMCILLNQNPLESSIFESPRHKLLTKISAVSFASQAILIKIKRSSSVVFFAALNLCALLLFMAAYVATLSQSTTILSYFPLIAATGLAMYLSMIRIVYAYANGVKMRYLFSFFRKDKCVSYEDMVGVTFSENKNSYTIKIRYIENEKIIIETFPYDLQENELIIFAKTLKQNKVALNGLPVNLPSETP